jgi:hypothetical protein
MPRRPVPLTPPVRFDRASVARRARQPEPGRHRLGDRRPQADDRLGVEPEGQLSVGVPKQRLGRLDVHARSRSVRDTRVDAPAAVHLRAASNNMTPIAG